MTQIQAKLVQRYTPFKYLSVRMELERKKNQEPPWDDLMTQVPAGRLAMGQSQS